MSKYKKTENQDKGIEDETDSCEIFTYDEGKVNRLKKEVVQTEGLSTYFKALADDNRLKIIHALSREELCVRDVADIIGTTMQVASHHLRVLRDIGLVKNRKEGKHVFYSLKDRKTAEFVQNVIEDLEDPQERKKPW
ncbi:MAG: metalloregulator ArsR/SmtB family transcription factor [Syntrophaceticus schinkii]|jgi:DNA-binding transcriptional ArsR family regulator|nr:metalloregulator ArsR/SmtB family transcription factor [Syntrophaceticus schinkii]MDD4261705.1 metalloregulator ArsR/SmtB family transcription factor [Syntrophaceticus schinkii]MDD4675293.1 metalloregulator ArsR/SmtB family transcription factor [Syntrophaceticus schinkii]